MYPTSSPTIDSPISAPFKQDNTVSASNNLNRKLDSLVLSIVLPVFNESAILERLHSAIKSTLNRAKINYEIIFINDGSSDDSGQILNHIASAHSEVKVLHFSRNFGHQPAIHAGLVHCIGNAIVVMDSDLQDIPEAIPTFVEKWLQGYDVIYAVRVARKESAWKRFLFSSFYRLLGAVSECDMPHDSGNFGLIDSRVKDTIIAMKEYNRFYSGLRAWSGFKQIGIAVERGSRYDDTPRVSLFGLIRLAKTAIFSFSSLPVSIFYVLAIIFAICLFASGVGIFLQFIQKATISHLLVQLTGYSLFAFINCLGIAVLGEYITRIYGEVRQRPQYIVSNKVNFYNQE